MFYKKYRFLYTIFHKILCKSLKLYFALNPRDYENTTIPYKDASDVKKYEDVPFVFKAKSDLSIRRAKQLIEARQDQYVLKSIYKPPITMMRITKSANQIDLNEKNLQKWR